MIAFYPACYVCLSAVVLHENNRLAADVCVLRKQGKARQA
jgi:hypothetical protein